MAVPNTVEVLYSDDEKWSDKESENEDNDEEEIKEGNSGWADAMAKILNKTLPEDKPVILTKYKKGNKRKVEQKEEVKEKRRKADERHTMYESNHVVPDRRTFPHDRELIRIATRGVVKLFNAVNKHQKETEAKLKKAPTENKKTKVIESMNKTTFLDMLKGTSDQHTSNKDKKQQKDKKTKPDQSESSSWSILQDDFMMGAKMKDWDREDENHNKKRKADLQDHELGNSEDNDDDDDGGSSSE